MVAIWFFQFFENYVLKISEANSLKTNSMELVAMSPLNKPDNCQGSIPYNHPTLEKWNKGKRRWKR